MLMLESTKSMSDEWYKLLSNESLKQLYKVQLGSASRQASITRKFGTKFNALKIKWNLGY